MGIGAAMYNGVSGLNSFSTAISVVSDNVANANTTGYKSNTVHFGDLVNSYYSIFANDTEGEGAGSMILGINTDYGQGTVNNTSNWSDLAVAGDGFFIVQDPATPTATYYTRDGGFHLDADGNLVNLQGYNVQGYLTPPTDSTTGQTSWSGEGNIVIANPQQYSSMRVDSDGVITGMLDGVDKPIAKIELASFSNKNGLVRQGGNMYMKGPDVGETFYNSGETAGLFGQVVDYSLENSNVDLAKEMVDMIIYQASYNANSKTITTAKDMMDVSINMIR